MITWLQAHQTALKEGYVKAIWKSSLHIPLGTPALVPGLEKQHCIFSSQGIFSVAPHSDKNSLLVGFQF